MLANFFCRKWGLHLAPCTATMRSTAFQKNLIMILFLGCAATLSACSEELAFQTRTPSTNANDGDDPVDGDSNGEDPDVDPIDPGGPGGPAACESTSMRTETVSITPDAVEGANVVFLIDDSGSMSGEFQKVVWELQDFINGILGVTSNNYRIVMIYNTDGAALNGRTFYRNRNNTNPILNANPFIDQIMSDDVDYFQKETWSKWSDVAFAKVFMPADFMQSLPLVIPTDNPNDSPITANSTPMISTDCQGAGKYFRPRDHTGSYGYGSFACLTAENHAAINDHLLPDLNVNIVAISDDDLNVAFDRPNFSPTDPTKNAYPEIVDRMFTDLVRPLGDDVRYIYHSIVGPIGSESGADVDKDGVAHMALSKFTGGATYDMREANWQPLFQNLSEQIIYSAKDTALSCKPAVASVQVTFNGSVVNPSNYLAFPSLKKLNFKADAFDGYPSGTPISVQISYRIQ